MTNTQVSINGSDRGVQLESLSDQMSVYADPDMEEICFEIDGNVINLGYDDPTVSRSNDDLPPIQLVKRGRVVELSNKNNISEIIVEQTGKPPRKVSTGETITLRSDSYIEPGMNTHFTLSFREATGAYPKIRVMCDALADICAHSPSEASAYATQLKQTIERHPPVANDISNYIDKLDSKIDSINNGIDPADIGLDNLAKEIQNLYEDSQI